MPSSRSRSSRSPAKPRRRPSRTPRWTPSRPTPTHSSVPFVGLTGGIGAGKSAALEALERLGAATLSADTVVHELLTTGEVRDILVAEFGDEVAPGGEIDRSAVASYVFADEKRRKWLEGILWPRVGARVAEFRESVKDAQAAVVEVPLLFESGMEAVFDKTIAVVAPEDVRAERAAARGHELVDARTAAQLSQEEKARRADFVVTNDGDLRQLETKLSEVLAKLEG